MVPRFLLVLCLIPLLSLSLVHAASDAPKPLGSDLYPAGTHLVYIAVESDAAYDTDFGTTGPEPGFHTLPSAQLGRVSGWVQTGDVARPEHGQGWAVWVNHYDSADHAANATADYAAALIHYGATPIHAMRVNGVESSIANQAHNKRWSARFVAVVAGSTEIEGITMFRTGHHDGVADVRYLRAQLEAALMVVGAGT